MASSIIVRGESVHCDAEVRTWHETGLLFVLPKRRETRGVVNHWTAAENPAPLLHANLRRAGKSVHFCIEHSGLVWQFCDTEASCSHAKGAGAWSVGIELINRGDAQVPTRGVERDSLCEEIHRKPCTYRAFTPEQLRAALALNEALCSAYAIPLAVPIAAGDVHSTVLTKAELATYRGVLGHLHLTTRKRDPGLALLRAIQARGAIGMARV